MASTENGNKHRPADPVLVALARQAAASQHRPDHRPDHWPDYVPPKLPPAASQAPPLADIMERTSITAQLVDRLHRRQEKMAKQLDRAVQRSLEDGQARGVLVVWNTDGLGWDVQLSELVPARTILEVRQEALEEWQRQGTPLV